MKTCLLILALCAASALATSIAFAQEVEPRVVPDSDATSSDPPAVRETTPADLERKAEQAYDQTRRKVDEVAADVNESEAAREAAAGILKPIYLLAEHMSFPAFHWVAFALMAAGVVGFALQLVLGKLVVLSRMSISISEILSDTLGLLISTVGLVLTTQAAAENSSFTGNAFAVLSATAVGVVLGFIHYRWGQRQELLAVEGGRRVRSVPPKT